METKPRRDKVHSIKRDQEEKGEKVHSCAHDNIHLCWTQWQLVLLHWYGTLNFWLNCFICFIIDNYRECRVTHLHVFPHLKGCLPKYC